MLSAEIYFNINLWFCRYVC